jgi:hypothetical protein
MTRQDLRSFPSWPEGRWARHRPWLLPLGGATAAYLGARALDLAAGPGTYPHSTRYYTAGAAALAVLLFGLVCMVMLPVNIRRVRRAYQRSRGRYTKAEMAFIARKAEADGYWQAARSLARELASGRVSDVEKVWGVVFNDGERIMADVQAGYARYYGTQAAYTHVSGIYFGDPTFTALAYGFTALGNASRRTAAQQAARTQWREFQRVRVLVTDQRLLCQLADGRWLSFYYQAATAIYPEPENWSLVIDFPETAPLRLDGLGIPLAAVATVWAVDGPDGVRTHPALANLWA